MKLNTELKTNIHNKFKIEVRNVVTKEIKQEGFAENIVLDRMYSRLMSFNSFFTRIHVGGGTGTLSPTRTTLFSPIANKEAIVDEKVKDYPVSSVTKKIQFGTTEQNGKTFTEVGISESTSAINTHALIKDAEGNPLSITKTDTDIITIYATIYFELVDNPQVDGKFNKVATENILIDYIIDGVSFAPSLWLGCIGGDNPNNYMNWGKSIHPLSRTSDNVNRINTYSTRLDVDTANYDIKEMSLNGVYRVDLENSQSWQPYNLQDVNIGVGDGVTHTFSIGRYDVKNLSAKVDGIDETNYSLQNIESKHREYIPFYKMLVENGYHTDNIFYNGCAGVYTLYNGGDNQTYILEVNPAKLIGETLTVSAGRATRGAVYVNLYASNDNINFDTLINSQITYGDLVGHTFTQEYRYIKLYITFSAGSNVYISNIYWTNPDYAEPTITFTTPPPEGAPITVSYTVPYIPKTEDYVIDLSLDLHW